MIRVLCSALALCFLLTPMPGASVRAQETKAARPTFAAETRVVVLHVAVRDRRGGYVGGLDQAAFRISENRQLQTVSFFHTQDAPVTVGLLIDSSGSMRPNREMVIAASVAFAKTMNSEDELFVLGFNDNIYAPLPEDSPFTREVPTLRFALDSAIKAIGKTAVYSAISAGLDYVTKGSFERQVLVLVSDGGDNASPITKAAVLAKAQASNAVIYTVGLIDPMDTEADPGFLNELAQSTGGLAFRPKKIEEVDEALQRVAHDIRNAYTLGFVPAGNSGSREESLRRVSVEVRLPDGQKASVRTRRAYLAGTHGDTSNAQ
jgi:Ca-activated chloride channel family protein